MAATTADAAAETNRMAKEKKDKALPLKDQPIKYWGKAYGGCSLVAVGGWLLLWLLFLLLDVLGAGLSPDFHWIMLYMTLAMPAVTLLGTAMMFIMVKLGIKSSGGNSHNGGGCGGGGCGGGG